MKDIYSYISVAIIMIGAFMVYIGVGSVEHSITIEPAFVAIAFIGLLIMFIGGALLKINELGE